MTALKREAFFASVAADVVRMMETSGMAWVKPWADRSAPRNPFTGSVYRGFNTVILGFTAMKRGYASPLWATKKQIAAAGGQVREDEKGNDIQCMFFQRVIKPDEEGTERAFSSLKFFWLYNVEQTTLSVPTPEARKTGDVVDEAINFIEHAGVKLMHGGDSAFYTSAGDFVQMPAPEHFRSDADYASTLMHETAHWTGHATRLDRNLKGWFGSPDYALEELVAELAAAMLVQHNGWSSAPREDHACYLNNWIKALRERPDALSTACSAAARAAGWAIDAAEKKEAAA